MVTLTARRLVRADQALVSTPTCGPEVTDAGRQRTPRPFLFPPSAARGAPRWRCRSLAVTSRASSSPSCATCSSRASPCTVYLSSVSKGLREPTLALLQQLKADHQAAAALCRKVGLRNCKELREAKKVGWRGKGLSAADLATLGTLSSVLPALEWLVLSQSSGAEGPDGVQRLVEGLGEGALPAVILFQLVNMPVGDAGASALAAALGRGALPRLKELYLNRAAIGDAGLVALAPLAAAT